MWKTGWKMFLDHPLTGVGDNEITEVYKKYKTIETHGEGAHLHSNIMMILATTGIFGFLAYAGFFLILFITQIKIYKLTEIIYYKALILGSILTNLSLHISGIFEWNFGKHNDMTLFFFLIAIPFVIYKFHSGKAKINMDIN